MFGLDTLQFYRRCRAYIRSGMGYALHRSFILLWHCSFLTSKVEVLKLARLLSGIHLCFPKEFLELFLRHTAAEDDSKATFPVMSVRRHFDK